MTRLERTSEVTADRLVHSFEGASDWVEIYRLPEDLEQQLNRQGRRRCLLRRSMVKLLILFFAVIAAVVSAFAAAAN